MQPRHWSPATVRDSSGVRRRFNVGDIIVSGASASKSSTRVRGWLFDQPYLLLSLTSLFWAGNTIIGRHAVGHVPPMTLAFVRWAGAFLILLPFAAAHLARDWPTVRKHAGMMALYALLGFSAYNTMAY